MPPAGGGNPVSGGGPQGPGGPQRTGPGMPQPPKIADSGREIFGGGGEREGRRGKDDHRGEFVAGAGEIGRARGAARRRCVRAKRAADAGDSGRAARDE